LWCEGPVQLLVYLVNELQDKLLLAKPATLTQMLSWLDDSSAGWRPNEFGVILQHQLSTPLLLDLGFVGFDLKRRARAGIFPRGIRSLTYRDLFARPEVPVELLVLVEHLAAANLANRNSPVPHDVSEVLCFACIATALVHHGVRIGQMNAKSLRSSLDRLAAQSWIDQAIGQLFEKALGQLSAECRGPKSLWVERSTRNVQRSAFNVQRFGVRRHLGCMIPAYRK
jgi:hypothetical protein